MVRIGTITGGVLFGGALLGPYIMPFLPLIITMAVSIIIGLCIKKFFISKMNKKFNRPYRFTNTDASASNQQTGGANTRHGNNAGTANTKRKSGADIPPPEPPPQSTPDSLSLYRNLLGGLKPDFTQAELKAAYRDAAAKYHPDRYAAASRRDRENAETLMKQINEAYGILLDKKRECTL
jgi:hypothetical protein